MAEKNYNQCLMGSCMEGSPGSVTILLNRVKQGDQDALAELVPLVYKELQRLAGHFMRVERVGHTLQPTALVHEAYLCLLGQERTDWRNRAQFMAIAAQIMRRILLQYARRRGTGKRMPRQPEKLALPVETVSWEEILAVDEALRRLGELAPQQARIAEMRYFGGLSVEETAEALGVSSRTVKRDWSVAKGWLHTQLSGGPLE
jgi:RNA polymerase sigma-70 factor (ECF subfamily)